MVEGMNRANGPNTLQSGIHYPYNFESSSRQLNRPDLWRDEYRMGHTWGTQFHQPHERGAFMDWELKAATWFSSDPTVSGTVEVDVSAAQHTASHKTTDRAEVSLVVTDSQRETTTLAIP